MHLNNALTNRLTNHDRQGSTGGNRCLAQCRVKWLIEHSTAHQLLWCIDSLVLRNPALPVCLGFVISTIFSDRNISLTKDKLNNLPGLSALTV